MSPQANKEQGAAERTPAEPNLSDLMARYQQADAEAAGALITAVSPQLYRFFLHQTGTRADASDLLQDTWLRIHKARHTYRPGEPVLPWFYAIARHARVDSFRKQSRHRREESIADIAEPAAPSREPASESFESLVAVLPPSQREVLTMLKVTGMSLEEVARATASSVGSVKQKAHRAYEKLRQVLSERSAEKGSSRS